MQQGWKRTALFFALVSIVVLQPALHVHAAAQYRVLVPAVVRSPTPSSPPPSSPPPSGPPPASRYTALELDTVGKINERRRAAGCANVTLNGQLSTAAERHSTDMATHNFMSHTGSDGSTFDQRIRAAGYYLFQGVGGIVAAGYDTADGVVQGWYNSPGHKAIMLDCRYRDIGISMESRAGTTYQYYWTADFGWK